jgi:ABC-type multidrug transport system ATPase subunit
MDSTNFGKIAAYIMQEDILLNTLTPRESLNFAAKIKLKASKHEINRRVEKLILQFGLEKCADSRIGSVESKGISGGERKRTSIAYEIISDPPIVIIDEPTTGMDSFTSLIIIKYLKSLASTGKTISKIKSGGVAKPPPPHSIN